jgi:hypothetical protein
MDERELHDPTEAGTFRAFDELWKKIRPLGRTAPDPARWVFVNGEWLTESEFHARQERMQGA